MIFSAFLLTAIILNVNGTISDKICKKNTKDLLHFKDLHSKDVLSWVLIQRRRSKMTFTITCSTLSETPQTCSQPETGLLVEQKLI